MKALCLIILLLTPLAQSAVNFNFNENKGEVSFKTKGWPNLVTIKGEGAGVTGQLKEANGLISGILKFDLKSLKTGISLRDDHMKNKYLEVEKFSHAELSITDLKAPSDLSGNVELAGTMKLHGVSKKVTGTAKISREGKSLSISAELPILLKEFAITIPSYKGITVADKVTVYVKTTTEQSTSTKEKLEK